MIYFKKDGAVIADLMSMVHNQLAMQYVPLFILTLIAVAVSVCALFVARRRS